MPERFVHQAPVPPELPTAAWINKAETKEIVHQTEVFETPKASD